MNSQVKPRDYTQSIQFTSNQPHKLEDEALQKRVSRAYSMLRSRLERLQPRNVNYYTQRDIHIGEFPTEIQI